MLNITNPRLMSGSGDVPHGSFVTRGYTGPQGREDIDQYIGHMPTGASEALARAGWDGTPLSTADRDTLEKHMDYNGKSFALNIHEAFWAYWTARGDFGAAQPAPPAPVSTEDLFEAFFPVGHELSAKLPKGSKARRAVGAFENMWGFARHFWELAEKEGIAGVKALLQPARDAALVLYDSIVTAVQEGQDTITGAVLDECQSAMDNYWNAMHAARKRCLEVKADGYTMYPNDPRSNTFQHSLLNRLSWRALANMTTAAGLYGLVGELKADGKRDATYVDAFVSFDSQDPLNVSTTGGGIGIAGQGDSIPR